MVQVFVSGRRGRWFRVTPSAAAVAVAVEQPSAAREHPEAEKAQLEGPRHRPEAQRIIPGVVEEIEGEQRCEHAFAPRRLSQRRQPLREAQTRLPFYYDP
jgi:hypothetical protein